MAGIIFGPKVYHLKRNPTQRWHLLRTMATQLVKHERIRSTHTKCLALQQLADKLIVMSVRSNKAASDYGKKIFWRRKIQSILTTKEAQLKTLNALAERFRERTGGFTRVVKLKNRESDNAPMAYIEFLGNEIEKYETALKKESKTGEEIRKEFDKKILYEQKDFFTNKLEEAKTKSKQESLRNEDDLKEKKITKDKFNQLEKVNLGVAQFFEEKLRRVEHDIWVINKNKYDLRRFPVYQ